MGQPNTNPTQVDIDRLYFKADARFKMLAARVIDAGIQERAKKLQKFCYEVNEPFPDRDSARKATMYASTHQSLMGMIGEVLTQLNAVDDQVG